MTEDQALHADKYARMVELSDSFGRAAHDLRSRARLGTEVLADDDVADSAELSRTTWARAEEDLRAATTGQHGLLSRSVELDADALVVRATVLTYRWIDELQAAAYQALGSIAGRAIGYLAPEVALGGAIVSAGLIETDALDRDGVATYLSELAEANPELLDHLSGGGGLLDGLQMRAVLTAGILAGDSGPEAARGGLRAIGVDRFGGDTGSALRDAAGGLGDADEPAAVPDPSAVASSEDGAVPRGLEELIATLLRADRRVSVQRVGVGRYIAYLPGGHAREGGRLRLVGADTSAYSHHVVQAIEDAVRGEEGARVLLVGAGAGGVTAADVAARAGSRSFVIDHVVTAGSPSAQVPVIPESTRVLSLEDRGDPIALLGSLVNAGVPHRMTVVFDGQAAGERGYLAGARAADRATHPELQAELRRIQAAGYLAG